MAWASAALARSRSVAAGIPTRRDLPFLARTQVQRQFDGQWTVGLSATYRRGTYFQPVIGRERLPGTEGWYAPIYADATAGDRFPNYQRIDLSASKILPLGEAQLILFINVNNALNAKNIRSYAYDATFSERTAEVYSRRLAFVGGVLQW